MSQGERDSGVPEGLEESTESGFSSDGRRVGGAPCERSERRAGEEFSGEKTRPGVNRSTLTLKGLKGKGAKGVDQIGGPEHPRVGAAHDGAEHGP